MCSASRLSDVPRVERRASAGVRAHPLSVLLLWYVRAGHSFVFEVGLLTGPTCSVFVFSCILSGWPPAVDEGALGAHVSAVYYSTTSECRAVFDVRPEHAATHLPTGLCIRGAVRRPVDHVFCVAYVCDGRGAAWNLIVVVERRVCERSYAVRAGACRVRIIHRGYRVRPSSRSLGPGRGLGMRASARAVMSEGKARVLG